MGIAGLIVGVASFVGPTDDEKGSANIFQYRLCDRAEKGLGQILRRRDFLEADFRKPFHILVHRSHRTGGG